MRNLKWIAAVLALFAAGQARGQSLSKAELEDISSKMITDVLSAHDHRIMMQSPGCSGGTFGQLGYKLLFPSDEAAAGGVTVSNTVYTTNDSRSVASHKGSYTVGTWVGIDVTTRNAQSRSWYFTVNGGSTHYGYGSASGGFSSPQTWTNPQAWLTTASEIGQTITFVNTAYAGLNETGNSTQDTLSFTVVDGSKLSPPITGPSLVDQDAVPSNFYARINPNFYMGDMMHACQICIDQPSACAGAQHTPYMTATLTNHTNGQVLTLPRQVAGTVVDENSPISGSLFFPDISVVAGDDIGISATGEIFCTAVADDIYNSLLSFRIEYAKVVAKDLGHPPRYNTADKSYLYDVAPICDNDSDPSDWQPSVYHSYSGRHAYVWGVTSLFRAPDQAGIQWFPLSEFLTDWNTSINGPLDLAKMVVIGGAVPYPANSGPDFPVPGKCTQYPKNVVLSIGSGNIPWWPWNN